jgi:transcriptional regulator with XRE-family HTH domain
MCRRPAINKQINEKPRETMRELVAQKMIMHEPVDQKLACRLRELRAHCNISLAELARAIGVTKGTTWKYMHGKSRVPAERLEMLARVMHCEEGNLHMPPGSPLPRLRFRQAREQTAGSSPFKVDFKIPYYLPSSADEVA